MRVQGEARGVLERDGAQEREAGRLEEEEAVRLQPAHGEELVVGADREARRVRVRRGGVRAARLVRVQHVVRAQAAVRGRREEAARTVRVGEREDLVRVRFRARVRIQPCE